MINYCIQIVLFQVLFLAVYDLFLKKETFFKWNRLYLLITPILSFIIPLLKFESIQKAVPQDYVVLLSEVVLNSQRVIEQATNSVETLNYLNIIFYVGAGFFLVLFIVKLSKIIQLIYNSKIIKKENYNLILLKNKQSAFSFFNYIFIDKSFIDKEELQIIKHELIHSEQYHTLDLLFFELLKIVMWFNPMIYSYQNRITLLHEYISDAEVIKETDKDMYFNKLLSETFNVENIAFINQFYKHSLIKKRIIMIAKEKSKSVKQLKYFLLIPVLVSMLFYTSCANEEESTSQENVIQQSKLQMKTSEDGKSGYIKTTEGTYVYIKNEDGSVFFYDKYGAKIGIEKIKGEGISAYEKDGWSVNVNKNDLIDSEDEISEGIPFSIIDKVPQFPGCTGDNQSLKDCLNREFQNHIKENFNADVTKNLGLSGKQKIYVKLKITKTGNIEIIGASAPHKDLEIEAKRVVNSLPKIIPGEFGGQKVNVLYVLPISFNIK